LKEIASLQGRHNPRFTPVLIKLATLGSRLLLVPGASGPRAMLPQAVRESQELPHRQPFETGA